MQLSPITPLTIHQGATAPKSPGFTTGIVYSGEGRFTNFVARPTPAAYGDAAGYGSLQEAIDALTFITVGSQQPAAGIFQRDDRFYARRMQNDLTFASGATWTGPWRLEQYPQDRELLDGSVVGATRNAALKAIVDGAQRFVITDLPVTGKATKPKS